MLLSVFKYIQKDEVPFFILLWLKKKALHSRHHHFKKNCQVVIDSLRMIWAIQRVVTSEPTS